ncbi:MAG: carbohydrate ABC transporter permease, partial [Mesorhizobium sp.]
MAEAMSQHRKAAFSLARHSTGIIASVLFLGPIVWTVLSTFKPAQEARQPPLPP